MRFSNVFIYVRYILVIIIKTTDHVYKMNFIQNKSIYQQNKVKTDPKRNILNLKTDNNVKVTKQNTNRNVDQSASCSTSSFYLCQDNDCNDNDKPGSSKTSEKSSTKRKTPGSSKVTANNTSADEVTSVIMAITEGRGHARGEVGIAAIDVNRPHLILCQLSDNFWYTGTLTKLNMFNPTEILFPNTFINSNPQSKLLEFIRTMYPNIPICPIPRRHFNDLDAVKLIDDLCSPTFESVKMIVSKKYYALSAASAILKYFEHILCILFAKKSLKIEYQPKYGTMMIDVVTSHRLELLYTLCNTKEKKSCLFGILNHCVTIIGKRTLRAKILQPSCDIPSIKSIHKCILELIVKDDLLYALQTVLNKFYHVDKLMKLAVIVPQDDNIKAAEIMINLMLLLKTCLDSIPKLCAVFEDASSKTFVDIRENLKDPRYEIILNEINTIIESDAQSSKGSSQYFHRLYAVKPNIDNMLDLTRKMYSELVDKIRDMTKELNEAHNQNFKMIHTISRGFHLQLTLPKTKILPILKDDFIVLYKKGFNVFLTTSDIIKLNFHIKDVINEIQILSNNVLSKLLITIRNEIDVIYHLTGLITELDLIQSLANVSKAEDYCCPTFGDEMRIEAGLHPLLEYSQIKQNLIPNHVIANPEYNFFIITGPNMGGKTIYIKMIAILQIMAQLGCFVPAKSAQFRICDKIFSRIGFGDNFEECASTFTVELREMEYIIANITPNSLVIIDELCRSTNPREGQLLAWKLCEKLICMRGIFNDGKYFEDNVCSTVDDDDQTIEERNQSIVSNNLKNSMLKNITAPFIFLTSHFLELTKLSEQYLSVVNLYLTAEERYVDNKLRLTYTHKIDEGVTPLSGYGLALARLVRFPSDIIPRAEEFLKEMAATQNHNTSITSIPRNNISIGYLNESFLPDNNLKSKNTTSNSTFLFDMERQLYDLYTNIVTILRKTKTIDKNFRQNQLNDHLKEFIKANPEFISKINQKANCIMDTTVENIVCEIDSNYCCNSSPKTNNTNKQSENSNEISSIANLTDLSCHSLRRRLNNLKSQSQEKSSSMPLLTSTVKPIAETQQVKKSYFKQTSQQCLPVIIPEYINLSPPPRLQSTYSSKKKTNEVVQKNYQKTAFDVNFTPPINNFSQSTYNCSPLNDNLNLSFLPNQFKEVVNTRNLDCFSNPPQYHESSQYHEEDPNNDVFNQSLDSIFGTQNNDKVSINNINFSLHKDDRYFTQTSQLHNIERTISCTSLSTSSCVNQKIQEITDENIISFERNFPTLKNSRNVSPSSSPSWSINTTRYNVSDLNITNERCFNKNQLIQDTIKIPGGVIDKSPARNIQNLTKDFMDKQYKKRMSEHTKYKLSKIKDNLITRPSENIHNNNKLKQKIITNNREVKQQDNMDILVCDTITTAKPNETITSGSNESFNEQTKNLKSCKPVRDNITILETSNDDDKDSKENDNSIINTPPPRPNKTTKQLKRVKESTINENWIMKFNNTIATTISTITNESSPKIMRVETIRNRNISNSQIDKELDFDAMITDPF